MTDRSHDLLRIRQALEASEQVLKGFEPGRVTASHKGNLDPVTAADLACDRVLREVLVEDGEGWLSEETADDHSRLTKERVWVVDPLDGTKEFVAGIPEWSVSVGLVENGEAVAGGVLNPATGLLALGAVGIGCTMNGEPIVNTGNNQRAQVLASRTEVGRGQWQHWVKAPFEILPMGSVAYKLARVACGLADATWTLVPKHEWDVAAGTALVLASGGTVALPERRPIRFNQPSPLLSGLVAIGAGRLPWLNLDDVIAGEIRTPPGHIAAS